MFSVQRGYEMNLEGPWEIRQGFCKETIPSGAENGYKRAFNSDKSLKSRIVQVVSQLVVTAHQTVATKWEVIGINCTSVTFFCCLFF